MPESSENTIYTSVVASVDVHGWNMADRNKINSRKEDVGSNTWFLANPEKIARNTKKHTM